MTMNEITDQEWAAICKLLSEGVSVEEVCEIFGITLPDWPALRAAFDNIGGE